jgi:hypothetical protein
MSSSCLAEGCANWTGFGCACEFFDLEPIDVTDVAKADDEE